MTAACTRVCLLVLLSIFVFSSIGCFGTLTPLGQAVNRDDLKDVQRLLAQGADPCEKATRGGHSSLDLAIGDIRELLKSDEINLPIYQALLENAYQGVLAGRKCDKILFYAARIGDSEKVRELIKRGADPNEDKENWESSPLGIAAYYGHSEAAAALIEGGADVQQQLSNFDQVRMWAVSIGRQSTYLNADRAISLLNKNQSKQQQSRKQQ